MNGISWGRKTAVGAMCVMWLNVGGGVIASGAAVPPGNTLTFTETFKDQENCVANEGCHTAQPDGYTIKATVVLSNVDLAAFGPATSFGLSLGSLSVTNKLGDDPMYLAGKTSATFLRTELNPNGKNATYLTVRLKWTTSLLTVTITGKTPNLSQSALVPIVAETYDGVATAAISGTTQGVIDFDVVSVDFNGIPISGSVVTKPVTAKDGSQVNLSTIKIKGTGTGN